MLDPRVLSLAQRIVPPGIVRRLDPFGAAIDDFVDGIAEALPAGSTVLDAGAGECRFRDRFRHARYVGIDFAAGDPEWDYTRLDAIARLEDIPLRAGSCDRVLSVVVLEHTPEPSRVVAEFYRVLRPGGRVHIVVPHMWEEHQRPHDYFRYTSAGIRFLLETSGFDIERIRPVGGFFWQLGRRLMAVVGFAQQGWRWILFPVLAPVFGFALPLCCYYLDRVDHDRAYTLGFICEGRKAR
jgi:SAM-dependent methyltransferase